MVSILDRWMLLVVKMLPTLGNTISVIQFNPFEYKDPVAQWSEFVEGTPDCSYIDYVKHIDEYKLHFTDISIAGIRCYGKNIPDEKLLEISQQYIASDSHLLIINEMCVPENQNSYIGVVQ